MLDETAAEATGVAKLFRKKTSQIQRVIVDNLAQIQSVPSEDTCGRCERPTEDPCAGSLITFVDVLVS